MSCCCCWSFWYILETSKGSSVLNKSQSLMYWMKLIFLVFWRLPGLFASLPISKFCNPFSTIVHFDFLIMQISIQILNEIWLSKCQINLSKYIGFIKLNLFQKPYEIDFTKLYSYLNAYLSKREAIKILIYSKKKLWYPTLFHINYEIKENYTCMDYGYVPLCTYLLRHSTSRYVTYIWQFSLSRPLQIVFYVLDNCPLQLLG